MTLTLATHSAIIPRRLVTAFHRIMNKIQFTFRAVLLTAFIILGGAQVALAQPAAQVVERSQATSSPQVVTRTYEKDGKTVTEKVTTYTTVETEARAPLAPSQKTAAIFITNRAGPDFEAKREAFEDMVTSVIADQGFAIISREVAINSLASSFDTVNQTPRRIERTINETSQIVTASGGTSTARVDSASQVAGATYAEESGMSGYGGNSVAAINGYGAAAASQYSEGGYQDTVGSVMSASQANSAESASVAASGTSAEMARTTRTITELAPEHIAGDQLDALLSNNTSALRLAQDLGADYLFIASITSFGETTRAVNAYGVQGTFSDFSLIGTYKIIDGNSAATLASGQVEATDQIRQTANAQTYDSNLVNRLLQSAANQIGQKVKTQLARLPAARTKSDLVSVTFSATAADLMIPDVRIGPNNTVSIGQDKYKVEAMGVTVEVNGVAVGTTPGTFKVRPGLSKVRLSRDGYKDWERTVNLYDGQNFSVALQLSDEGYARWKNATGFMNNLQNNARLTDGEVKVLEGQAKMLEQSGFKVDTKDAPKIEIKEQSLFR